MPRCNTSVRVLRLRLKDKHSVWLNEMASDVNFVWNYCNELSGKIFERERRFAYGIELQRYLNGASKAGLGIGSAVFQQIAEEYATRRHQQKKVRLAWRKSGGVRRSLGWIPFKARALRYEHGQVFFQGQWLSLWDSYGLGNYVLRAGCLAEDARGRWYLNVCVEVEKTTTSEHGASVGLDLGLNRFAATSDGDRLEAPRFYRELESKLAIAQRARKHQRVKAIHAKIANRRKDFLHQHSTALVRKYSAVFVGNVNARALTKTRFRKGVLDAGWGAYRTMLQYKCADAGVWFEQIDEAYSTQTCSDCNAVSGPKGFAGLGIREWTCGRCGAAHDRDVNAAKNILAAGHRRLAEGIPAV